MTIPQKIRKNIASLFATQPKKSSTAYDLWASSYDYQPKNLMLYLDGEIFKTFLSSVDLTGKGVLDIGCGTGRHWGEIFSANPAEVIGYDVSAGMLNELKRKYPAANVELAKNNLLKKIADRSVDTIVSTLTIAHIEDIGEAFKAWVRVLKPDGEIFITDYHPQLLAKGGKRDFSYNKKHVVIKNYVHNLQKLIATAEENEMEVLQQYERFIDISVKHFYAAQDALQVYEKYIGTPVIYGLHMRKL